ncbi:MAG TPA: hypothetical protein VFA27_10965 [Vicinamibacterales bacterium]|nr:hypothetical protein [Vicinamibacterales bacterium]
MTPFQQTADVAIPELAGLQRRALLVGGAFGLVSLVGAFVSLDQFLPSYLIAYMFCLGVTLGCMALGMVHQLSGGAWGVVLRRPIGAASRVLPILTLLFIPIVLGMHRLYIWTHADVVAHDEALLHKQVWLNAPFWIVRAAVYFAIWNALSFFLNRWSLEQDRTGDPFIARRMQKTSAGGLVLYGITITLASFDWLMSLEPHWYSTIFGAVIMAGQGLSALAFLLVVIVWLSRRPPLDTIIVRDHFHDVSNLMLAFVMLWAYFSFSQFLIIWAGNLPAEIAWYQHRLDTGWRLLGTFLMVFHFAVPFVLLLLRVVKRTPDYVLKLAVGVLIVRVVDLLWLVDPEFHPNFSISWLDVVLPIALFGLWTAAFVWQLRGRAILPVHDPQFDEALGKIIERGGEPRTAH